MAALLSGSRCSNVSGGRYITPFHDRGYINRGGGILLLLFLFAVFIRFFSFLIFNIFALYFCSCVSAFPVFDTGDENYRPTLIPKSRPEL